MKILVSNDDGVQAPGIRALAQKLASIAEIIVIAPDRNRSGSSNSLTLTRPLRIRQCRRKTPPGIFRNARRHTRWS